MAKQGKIRTLVEYGIARSVLGVMGLLPINRAMNLGRALGNVGYLFAGDLRRTAEINLKLALPEKSVDERRRIIRGCFQSLGRQLGLFGKFSKSSGRSVLSLVDVEGLEHIVAATKTGTGVITFTIHMGAWELTCYAVSFLVHPFSVLVRPIDNAKVEELIDQHRTSSGNVTLDKFSAARSMVKILRSGQMLGLLLDLNTLDDEGIFVDFFGVPASTNFITAKLALRTGAPIIPVFAPWDQKRGKYLLQVCPPILPESTGNEEDDVRRLTQRVTSVIEQHIRRYPDQWLWIHKRWKTRPPGEPSIY